MNDEGIPVWLAAILFIAVFFIGLVVGVNIETEHFRQVALDAGVAERRVDEHGEVTFHFIECGGEEATP